jgi:hypothetical protein
MIYKAMIAVMRNIDFIPKDKNNLQQNYHFRGIDDMYNAIHPLFKTHGIFVLSDVLEEKREERRTKTGGVLLYSLLLVRFSFVAEDGSRVTSTTKGEAMDSGDKASNKAMSSALKYAVMQTFMIPTKELANYNTENEEYDLELKNGSAPKSASAASPQPPQTNYFLDNEHAPTREAYNGWKKTMTPEEIKETFGYWLKRTDGGFDWYSLKKTEVA